MYKKKKYLVNFSVHFGSSILHLDSSILASQPQLIYTLIGFRDLVFCIVCIKVHHNEVKICSICVIKKKFHAV